MSDLSSTCPDLVSTMQSLLQAEVAKIIPRVLPVYKDPLSDPILYNYTWHPWIESQSMT